MNAVLDRPPIDAEAFAIYSGGSSPDESLRQEDSNLLLDKSQTQLDILEAQFVENGCQVDPDLTVDAVDVNAAKIRADKEKLIAFSFRLDNLITADRQGSSEVLDAYRQRVSYDIAMTNMVLSAVRKNWKEFRRFNEFIYDPTNALVDAGVKDWLAGEATAAIDDSKEHPSVKAAAERARDILGKELGNRKGRRDLIIPDPAVFEATMQQSWSKDGYMTQILDGLKIPSGLITEVNGDDVVTQMFRRLGASTEIKPGRYWNYHPDTDKMERPQHYEIWDWEFPQYWGHESLHVLEAFLAQNGPLMLAITGLDRYCNGNEGSAIIPEQIADKKPFEEFTEEERWQILLARHLSSSLGSGMNGLQKSYGFAELYKVLKDIFYVYEARRSGSPPLDEAAEAAHKQAWRLTCVVKAGTNGSADAGTMRRPETYIAGNVAAWRREARKPGVYAREAVGKYNQSNPRHRRIMAAVGALAA